MLEFSHSRRAFAKRIAAVGSAAHVIGQSSPPEVTTMDKETSTPAGRRLSVTVSEQLVMSLTRRPVDIYPRYDLSEDILKQSSKAGATSTSQPEATKRAVACDP